MSLSFYGALAFGIFIFFAIGALTGNMPRFGASKKRKPALSKSQVWIRQSGLDLTPRQFWVSSVALGLVGFIFFVLLTGSASISLVPAICVTLWPRAYFARRRVARLRSLLEAWPDAIRDLHSAIQANISLQTAVSDLARTGPPALREAFVRFPALASTLGTVPALEIIREELADPTSDRVIEVLILAHERGGAIVSDILRDLAQSTTQDIRVSMEIETNALEQKINARAVFFLPWIVLILLTMQKGEFRDFYQSSAGVFVVLLACTLSLLGMYWVSRLGRETVEGRVFGASGFSQIEVLP